MGTDGELICADVGTTNSRAWRLRGPEVVARAEHAIGARDVARAGSNDALRAALLELVGRVLRGEPDAPRPSCIAAAGMLTSRHGLLELPYVEAPAGARELRAAVRRIELPGFSGIPWALVPGVRTAARPGALPGALGGDVMRGEETSCLGLLELGRMRPGDCLLNLGSHWKLVQTDADARIAWSFTSLAGELLHAVRRETVLASTLPDGSLAAVDAAALHEGAAELRRSGLPRALFGLRLLELLDARAPERQLSFALGALVASDLDAWRRAGLLPAARVLIAGDDKVGGAWSLALRDAGCQAAALPREDVEAAFLLGLRSLSGC
jgi:2-dehydro-3-deoxygalactonokinase